MDATLRKLVEDGLTTEAIAGRLGKSVPQVYRLLKKFGLKTKRHNDHDPHAKTRVCRYCGCEKPLEEFPTAGVVNGVHYRRWKCESCYHGIRVMRRQSLREWFDDLKKKYKCVVCKEPDFRLLDFHHPDDNKEFNLGDAVRQEMSRDRILREVAKCQPMCVRCHRILTYEERKNGV